MKFKTLKTDAELLSYSKTVAPHIDVELPLEYLKRSKVVACFDDEKNICGGFVIVKQGPFRVLESIPTAHSLATRLNRSSKVAEITGLWLSDNVTKKRESLNLWLRLIWGMITSGKNKFTYAYSLKKPSVGKLYQAARPRVLFSGPTKILPGMPCADYESVEFFHLKNLLSCPFRRPDLFIKRFFGERKCAESSVMITTISSET